MFSIRTSWIFTGLFKFACIPKVPPRQSRMRLDAFEQAKGIVIHAEDHWQEKKPDSLLMYLPLADRQGPLNGSEQLQLRFTCSFTRQALWAMAIRRVARLYFTRAAPLHTHRQLHTRWQLTRRLANL